MTTIPTLVEQHAVTVNPDVATAKGKLVCLFHPDGVCYEINGFPDPAATAGRLRHWLAEHLRAAGALELEGEVEHEGESEVHWVIEEWTPTGIAGFWAPLPGHRFVTRSVARSELRDLRSEMARTLRLVKETRVVVEEPIL